MPSYLDRLPQDISPDLADTIDRIAGFGAALARRIARGGLDEALGTARGANADGDTQKALDIISDEMLRDALDGGAVRFYGSEEQDDIMTLGDGSLALVVDPLDGSSNIDTNVSVGTIFGLYPAADTAEASVLRTASDLIAAGYIIYGPQCCLMLRVGEGAVLKYVLDPEAGRFRSLGAMAAIPAQSTEYAINASNYRHWPTSIRAYIDDRIAGSEGPMGHDFNMRWIASLVAEAHRVLTRGGIFLYPGDSRPGYEQGRLRLVYECGPISFLIEGAGGAASDGTLPIRERVPKSLHERSPLVFGSRDKVARVATYHDLPESEVSALFGSRGLFRR